MIIADLHIHSHYSRATSKNLDIPHLVRWAQLKGVHLLATGDIAHPGWLQELQETLMPAEDGLFRPKPDLVDGVQETVPSACHNEVRFVLGGEISNIYKRDDAVRKVHNLIFAPSFEAVTHIQNELEKIGNIRSDGRPILGLDSQDLFEIVLDVDERCQLIPAHIWTPWFSMLGSKSGFDSLTACFGDLSQRIVAVESGLSSDPPMNWRVSQLDPYTLVSSSDAHSPQKVAREATLFEMEWSYDALFDALRSGDAGRFKGTLEFFPEEGKYHMDGHRKCGVCWRPGMTRAHGGLCSQCGRPVTVGVMHRVEELADRPEGGRGYKAKAATHPFRSLIPLPEILAEINDVGANTKTVQTEYMRLLTMLGPELSILLTVPVEEIRAVGGERLAEGIARMRRAEVECQPGFDGEFGVIRLFDGVPEDGMQMGMFGGEEASGTRHKEGGDSAVSAGLPVHTIEETLIEGTAVAQPEKPVQVGQPVPQNQLSEPIHAEVPVADADQDRAADDSSGVQEAPGTEHAAAYRRDSVLPHLDQLNPAQKKAVETINRSLIIVAGPGTGKTRTLTMRIAYLIAQEGVSPQSILAITFTNKAAREMAERLAALLGDKVASRLTVRTFHAFGAMLLRQWGDRIDLDPQFTILGPSEQLHVIQQVCPQLNRQDARQVLARISTAKNRLLTPDMPDLAQHMDADVDFVGQFAAYQDALVRSCALDFDDLLVQSVYLLEVCPEAMLDTQERFRWISVDEYQDINHAQHRLLQLLTQGGANLCVIGDPDQAIYGFRGADDRYFHSFQQDFPGARRLRLARSYRSVQTILDAAIQVIEHNTIREESDGERSNLWSDWTEEVKLHVHRTHTDRAEAEYVVHQIEQMVGGTSYFSIDSGRVEDDTAPVERAFGDFAVLYRLNAQARPLMEAFDRSGIPYQCVGDTPFYAREDVLHYLAYQWLAHCPRSRLHLESVLAVAPAGNPDGPPEALIDQIIDAVSSGETLAGALRDAAYSQHVPQEWKGVRQARLAALAELYSKAAHDGPVSWLQRTHAFLQEWDGGSMAEEDFASLVRRAAAYEGDTPGGHLAFLEAAVLQSEADDYAPHADRVTLMTLHASKGLEFPVVFMVGCEEGVLPYKSEKDPADTSTDLAEERRLFYVGMTRAERRLILASARRRFLFGQSMENWPSRFIGEIEDALKAATEAKRTARPPLEEPEENEVQLKLI